MGHDGDAVHSRVWVKGQPVAENFPFEQLSDFLAREECLVWVDLDDPDHSRLTELAQELDIEPLAVEDAVAHLERTKAIRYSGYSVLTTYATQLCDPADPESPAPAAPDRAAGRSAGDRSAGDRSAGDQDADPTLPILRLERVSAFVLPRALITVRHPGSFTMDGVLQRWSADPELLAAGVGALVHGLLDVIVDGHFDAVQALDDAMEDLEDGLFNQEALGTLVQRRSYQIRKDLVSLRRVALPMRELVNAVLRHRRVAEWTESLRDMVTTVFETNLSLQDARLNTVMKKLTSWAAIIAIPTAVTGYFGQNVPFPGFSQHSGFIASTVLIVGLGLALYIAFRRKDWL
jgi:magnesium transporter